MRAITLNGLRAFPFTCFSHIFLDLKDWHNEKTFKIIPVHPSNPLMHIFPQFG